MVLFALSCLAFVLPRIAAQSVTTIAIPPIVPNGVQNFSSSLESTLPTECVAACFGVDGSYFYCYVNSTLPDGTQFNTTGCDAFLCQQTTFTQLSQCLNCIVANGNERPFGYHTNTSMTAAPTQGGGDVPFNPNGFINSTQADGILKNVSDHCASVSSSVTGATTVTATPTTTGPYYTSWTSGATVSISVWTGLTSYTSDLSLVYETETVIKTLPGTTSLGSSTASQSASQSGAGGSTSAASASGSSTAKSAALRRVDIPVWARVMSELF